MIAIVSCTFPRYFESKKDIGSRAISTRRAVSGVILPAGIGRHDLLRESSRIEEGRRWFAMSQIRRLMLIHKRRIGKWEKADRIVGVVFVVRTGPERAVKRAKSVCGIVTHSMLAFEKR
jgi:hypothetical protein